jgi:hypothetical protein
VGSERAAEGIVKGAAFSRGTDTVLHYSARGNQQVFGSKDRANRGGRQESQVTGSSSKP